MGNRQSRSLKRAELKKLIAETHFGQDEIKALHSRFQAISNSVVKDGLIDQGEFLQALGLPNSTLGQRIFAVFDADASGGLDFREFCAALSTLCTKATLEEKIAFSFRVYDLDGDGNIDKSELLQVLKASMLDVDVELSDDHLKALVDATFEQTDANGDDKISLEEYRRLVEKSPNIIANISIKSDLLATTTGASSASSSTSASATPAVSSGPPPSHPPIASTATPASSASAPSAAAHRPSTTAASQQPPSTAAATAAAAAASSSPSSSSPTPTTSASSASTASASAPTPAASSAEPASASVQAPAHGVDPAASSPTTTQ